MALRKNNVASRFASTRVATGSRAREADEHLESCCHSWCIGGNIFFSNHIITHAIASNVMNVMMTG